MSNLAVHFRGRLVDINIGDVNSLLSTARVKFNDAERGEDVPRLALLHQLLRLVNGPDDPAEVSRLVKAGFQSVVHSSILVTQVNTVALNDVHAATTRFIADVYPGLAIGPPAARLLRVLDYVSLPDTLGKHCYVCARPTGHSTVLRTQATRFCARMRPLRFLSLIIARSN